MTIPEQYRRDVEMEFREPSGERPSGWAVGWTAFAAGMMVMMGFWWVMVGVVAIINANFYAVSQDWIFKMVPSTWGWVHLGIGIVITLAGFGVINGRIWARTVGVILTILAALVAFAWLPTYPVWASLLIAVSVLVIWALTVHGRDMSRA